MADQWHDASFADAIRRPRVVGPMTDASTSVSRESVAERRVAYEGPAARIGRTTAAGPEADDLVAARTTALYTIRAERTHGICSECAGRLLTQAAR